MKNAGIIVAGFGGQGILFLGRLIAYGGMLEGKEVAWFPSYGAEMRGGTANCTVIISDEMIGSPIIRNPDILIAMNEASLKRFQLRVKTGGIVMFDSSFVRSPELRADISSISIPASEIAALNNSVKASNMIILGAFIALTGLLKDKSAIEALECLIPEKRKEMFSVNKEAIRRGMKYIADKKRANI